MSQANTNPSPEQQIDIGALIHDKIEQKLRERGRVNVLIAGKTGVGKSTLINTVFQGNLATTGQGRPITQKTREISKKGVPVRILDTRGLELGEKEFKETLSELERVVKQRQKSADPNDHIHVAWLCVLEASDRIEDQEVSLAEMLDGAGVPVVGVLTKAMKERGMRQTFIDRVPVVRNVVRVRALAETFEEVDVTLPVMGLEDLVDVTMEVVPEGQEKAVAAAQHVSLRHKVNKAHAAVAAAALTAGGIGAAPVPFSDAVGIVPVQISMLAGITAVFGLDLDKGFISAIASSALGATGGTMAGKAIVANLLKMSGVGTGAGMMIAGGTAAALTTTIGEAYTGTLYALLKGNPDRELSPDQVADMFLSKLTKKDAA